MLGLCCSLTVSIAVVRAAVSNENIVIPHRIQNIANNFAAMVLGALSPYPTVVIEINAHHKPERR